MRLRLTMGPDGVQMANALLATLARKIAHPYRHAIVAGSLGKGNLGDYMLMRAFLGEMGDYYWPTTVLTDNFAETEALGVEAETPPSYPVGRRYWSAIYERNQLKERIKTRSPLLERDYVWLGGLFSTDKPINLVRRSELAWARQFCSRFVYYFGDAHDSFSECSTAADFVKLVDGGESWIAVRSKEAADVLVRSGVKSKIRVGLDSVLYELSKALGLAIQAEGGRRVDVRYRSMFASTGNPPTSLARLRKGRGQERACGSLDVV